MVFNRKSDSVDIYFEDLSTMSSVELAEVVQSASPRYFAFLAGVSPGSRLVVGMDITYTIKTKTPRYPGIWRTYIQGYAE